MGSQQLLTPAGVTKDFIKLLKILVKFQTQLSFLSVPVEMKTQNTFEKSAQLMSD